MNRYTMDWHDVQDILIESQRGRDEVPGPLAPMKSMNTMNYKKITAEKLDAMYEASHKRYDLREKIDDAFNSLLDCARTMAEGGGFGAESAREWTKNREKYPSLWKLAKRVAKETCALAGCPPQYAKLRKGMLALDGEGRPGIVVKAKKKTVVLWNGKQLRTADRDEGIVAAA